MPKRGASSTVNMDSEKRTDAIHSLDMEYQEASHRTRMVLRDEEARRLKLRSLLLQDDNAVVRDELSRKNRNIKELQSKLASSQEQIQIWTVKTRSQEKQMLAQGRELANIKEEIESLTGVTQDSAKILTEKLALSRELALLKPEIEHLRSQLAHEKDVLTEKLAIERQLNALEVELANEKRAAEKAAQKQQGQDNEAEEELRQQLSDLEKQLAKEKRAVEKAAEKHTTREAEVDEELRQLREQLAESEEKLVAEKRAAAKAAKAKNANTDESAEELEQLRLKLSETENALALEKQDKERIRKEGERAVAEAEGLRLPLEERIDNLKVKLRETREELKSCRAELQRVQEAATTVTTKVPTKKAAPVAKVPAAKKRRANELAVHDDLLQTPNRDEDRPKRAAKKPFAPAAVGEKSTFSITPFLNKTINISDASLKAITEDAEDEDEDEDEDEAEAAEAVPTKSKTTKQPKGKPLAEASPSKHNIPMLPHRSRKAPGAEITLENVIEDPEEREGETGQENLLAETVPEAGGKDDAAPKKKRMVLKSRTAAAGKVATVTAAAPAPATEDAQPAAAPAVPEPKKKKRKLAGVQTSTLFDDAEDVPAPAAVVPATAAVKRAPPGRVNLGAGLAAKRAVGAAGKNPFGAAFSPLKRDRRGVGASFLA